MPYSGLDAMVDLHRIDDLGRLYRLFTMVPSGLSCVKKSLKDSIARRGKDINQASLGVEGMDVEGDVNVEVELGSGEKGKGKGGMRPPNSGAQTLALALKWVQDVLDLKDKFDRVWELGLRRDRELEITLNEVRPCTIILHAMLSTIQAFESFINLNEKSPEFISLFIDENLKKGLKGVSLCPDLMATFDQLPFDQKTDIEVDIVLDKTITVFRYLTEKDVFERYYKGHLAKRLLLGRSVSDDAERGMLAKLKVEAGYQFTQKLEGMFHDMKLSDDTMQAYRNHLAKTTVCF